ncbi:unnamed protein product [Umbelopsis ramanniana]
MWGSGWLATFLMFCAWLLQLFTVIGGLNNLPFLNEAYYNRVQSNNQANRNYLWNQCSEDPLGTVNQCSYPVAGYEWGSLPPYNTVPGISGHSKTFFALSAVTWIAFGITTLTLLSSLITHCCCRKRMSSRWFDFNHFWWGFIAWLAQLAAFILAVVFGTHGGYLLENGLSNTTYSLGPSTWMSLGAFLALTLSLMLFCCGFCIARKNKNRPTVDPTYDDQPQYAQTATKEKRGWFGRKKQTPAEDPEMAYNSTGAYNSGAYDTPGAAGAAGAGTYGASRAAGNDTNAYNTGSGAYGNSGNTGSAYDSTQNNPHTGAKAAAAGAAGVAAGAYGAKKYNQTNSTGSTGAYGSGKYDNSTTGGAYGTGNTGNYDTTTGAPIGAATGATAGAYGAGSTGNYNNNATGTTGAYGEKTYDDTAAGTTGAYGAGNTTGNYNNAAGTTGAYGAGNTTGNYDNAATTADGSGSYGNPQTTTGGAYNNDTGIDNDSSVYHTPATGYEQGTNPGGTAYRSGTGVYDNAADGYNNLTGYDTNDGSAANDTNRNVRV